MCLRVTLIKIQRQSPICELLYLLDYMYSSIDLSHFGRIKIQFLEWMNKSNGITMPQHNDGLHSITFTHALSFEKQNQCYFGLSHFLCAL